jgi:hypothetical protein
LGSQIKEFQECDIRSKCALGFCYFSDLAMITFNSIFSVVGLLSYRFILSLCVFPGQIKMHS